MEPPAAPQTSYVLSDTVEQGIVGAMEEEPLVTIVTPCLNSAPFIARTIESVVKQDYPHIEHIVMDGGSTDGTLDILKTFGERLQCTSASDAGAADAINRGFLRSRGSVFAWLNADDVYLPGAISTAVGHLITAPEVAVVYGEGIWVDQDDAVLGRYPTVSPYDKAMLERECSICQPASFIRREAFAGANMLDPKLQSAFDYDLWIRLSQRHRFLAVPDVLAASRMHAGNKSLAQRRLAFEEAIHILSRHFEYVPVNWIYGYLTFLQDGRDQYFQPLQHSLITYLASLPVGTFYNYKRMLRYWADWASRVSIRNLRRFSKAPGSRER